MSVGNHGLEARLPSQASSKQDPNSGISSRERSLIGIIPDVVDQMTQIHRSDPVVGGVQDLI
jgi:hypothetical protein